jgi:hypothetical protein
VLLTPAAFQQGSVRLIIVLVTSLNCSIIVEENGFTTVLRVEITSVFQGWFAEGMDLDCSAAILHFDAVRMSGQPRQNLTQNLGVGHEV